MKLKKYETADGILHLFHETSDKTETGFYCTLNADFPDASIRRIEKLLNRTYNIVGIVSKTSQRKAWDALSDEERARRLKNLNRGRSRSIHTVKTP